MEPSKEHKRGAMLAGIIIAATIFCVVAGIVSTKYLGDDNVIEDTMETVAEDIAEKELKLAPGTLKPEADLLFPHKKDNNK